MGPWVRSLRRRSVPVRSGLLALGVLALYALVVPVAGYCCGLWGLAVAATAAAVCLAGAELALAASHILRAPQRTPWAILLATALRMGIPLGFALFCALGNSPMVQSGVLYYLVVFYLGTLFLETLLSLPVADQSDRGPSVSSNVMR